MSGRKSNLRLYQSVTNGVMTGTNVLTSAITNVQMLDNCAVQFNWTSSPVGTFQVQVSIDHAEDSEGNVTVAGNWASIPLTYLVAGVSTTALTIPTSVGSPVYVDLNQMSSPWLRVVYTNASGSGVLNAYITGKML